MNPDYDAALAAALAATGRGVTNLAYDDTGAGDPVLFIAGTGGAGRTWHIHQVPVFLAAGYRCITFDNRGVGATENADGFSTAADGRRHRRPHRDGRSAARPGWSPCRWARSSPRNSCWSGPTWSARRC